MKELYRLARVDAEGYRLFGLWTSGRAAPLLLNTDLKRLAGYIADSMKTQVPLLCFDGSDGIEGRLPVSDIPGAVVRPFSGDDITRFFELVHAAVQPGVQSRQTPTTPTIYNHH